MTPRPLGARDGAFTLAGRRTYLYDGELHYFRVAPALWRPGLERLKALGMNAVSTYIPWVWHEPEPGVFDFDGSTRPGRDLAGFLDTARAVGLAVMARPGPLIYAEFDGLGIPLWLGDRHPETVIVRRDGRRDRGEFFWNYSVGHPTFRARAHAWYEALAAFLAPWWNDPVVSWQLDNETGLMFANRIGQIDFNPDTIRRFRAWLLERYGTIEALNEAWSSHLAGFAAVLPPRPPLRQAQITDWQWFLEDWIEDYLRFLARTARAVGVPVPLTHNEQGIQHSPLHGNDHDPETRIDFIGYDIYPKASPGKFVADFPFASSLYPGIFSAYRTPTRPTLALELGTGWFDPRAHVTDAAVVQNIFGSLAHGARGICLFTMHDGREPSGEPYDFGGPLDGSGRPTSRYGLVGGVGTFLARWGDELLAMEEIKDPVGFGIYFPSFRYAADDYFSGSEQVDPHRYLEFLAQGGIHALLLCAGINPHVVDLSELEARPLADLQVLFLSSKRMLDLATYAKLESYVLGGGHLVTTPGPPDRDLHGKPARFGSLFPLAPDSTTRLDAWRVWWTIVAGVVPYLLFERPWLSDRHRSSGHIIDLFEPLLDALRTPVEGRPLIVRSVVPGEADEAEVRRHRMRLPDANPPSIRGDFIVHTFAPPRDPDSHIRPGPLWLGDRPAAYEVTHGWGTSTVLGTLPAGRYLTPRYYTTDDRDRRALRQFARGLLADRGVEPLVHCDVEAEVVGHAGEDGGMLFVINRIGRQAGDVRLSDPELFGYSGRLEIAYTHAGSRARAVNARTIRLDLMPDDVLVLRLH
jgi:hypothetical protein